MSPQRPKWDWPVIFFWCVLFPAFWIGIVVLAISIV